MNEDITLRKRFTDLANRAYQQNIFTYTSFLSINELDIYNRYKDDYSYIHSEAFGGTKDAERCIVRFGSPLELGYDTGFPINIIKVSPLIEKFGEVLTHRDYLGAILNLGIERTLIGDILINEKIAYIFCLDHISDYIIDNLIKIKHTNVKCDRCSSDDYSLPKPNLENIEIIVASPRIDAVAASITKQSRNSVNELFSSKKIYVNGLCMENRSYQLKEGDILVIRGVGKLIYDGCGHETRKGRVYVKLRKYI